MLTEFLQILQLVYSGVASVNWSQEIMQHNIARLRIIAIQWRTQVFTEFYSSNLLKKIEQFILLLLHQIEQTFKFLLLRTSFSQKRQLASVFQSKTVQVTAADKSSTGTSTSTARMNIKLQQQAKFSVQLLIFHGE